MPRKILAVEHGNFAKQFAGCEDIDDRLLAVQFSGYRDLASQDTYEAAGRIALADKPTTTVHRLDPGNL